MNIVWLSWSHNKFVAPFCFNHVTGLAFPSLEQVKMRPKVILNRLEISNGSEKLLSLYDCLTAPNYSKILLHMRKW